MKWRSLESKSQPFTKSSEITVFKNPLVKKGQLVLTVLIPIVLGLVVVKSFQKTEKIANSASAVSIAKKRTNVLPVSTVVVKTIDSYQTTQTYTGEVFALRTSEVGFERGGKIVTVAADEGDFVNFGQTLAQLDTATLQVQKQGLVAQKAQAQAVLAELQNGARSEQVVSAQARVKDLEKQLELAQIRNNRREYLLQEGAISQEQLDEVTFNRQALQARLKDAQSNLTGLKNGTRVERITAQQAAIALIDANIAELDLQINKSILKAPFAGVVASRNFDEGTVIQAGDPVVRLVENDRLEVRIGVPATAMTTVDFVSSQKIIINGKTHFAKVDSVLPEIDPNTRTRTLVLTLDATTNRQVAPGEIARLELSQTAKTEGYWLPIQSVSKSDRGLWSCFSVVTNQAGDSIIERQYLEILAMEAKRVLVKGTIQAGDLIVTEGIHRLIPGQQVMNSQ